MIIFFKIFKKTKKNVIKIATIYMCERIIEYIFLE